MFDDVIFGYFAEIILEMFVVVFASPFEVGVLFFGVVLESELVEVGVDLAVGEVAFEVGVLEGVVVGEGHLADVVVVYEGFLGHCWLRQIASSHSIKLNIYLVI